jgi:hypothetical protein
VSAVQPHPSRTLARTSSLALGAMLSLGAASPALAQGGSPGSPSAQPTAPAPPAKPGAAPAKPGAVPPAKPGAVPPAKPGAPGAAPPAKPGAPGAASPADDDVTRLVNDGLKASKAGKWDEARALLGRAFRLKKSWRVAGDLGAAEVGGGQFRDAAEHVYFALGNAPADLPDPDRKVLDGLFAQATSKVGALTFKVHPQNAEVFVNGVSVGKAPLEDPVFVDPGTVEVEVKGDGFTAIRTQRAVAAGTEEAFDLTLHRSGHFDAPAPPPTPVDSVLSAVDLPIVIGGAAGTGVGIILGAALAITSDLKASKSHALEQPTATCGATCASQFSSLQTQKVNFAGGAMWSFIGAGALLLGTGAYVTVMVIQKPGKQQDVRAGITVAPDHAAASLTARW